MNIEEFVAKCKAGEVRVVRGEKKEGMLIDRLVPITIKAETITEEAYKRGVFTKKTSWDEALRQVNGILKRTGETESNNSG